MNYSGLKIIKSSTYTHTHTHTSRRQLKMIFLDVLDLSEYSDNNISNFFSRRHSFPSEEAKTKKEKRDWVAKHTLRQVTKVIRKKAKKEIKSSRKKTKNYWRLWRKKMCLKTVTSTVRRSNESCAYSYGYIFQPRSRHFLDTSDSCSTFFDVQQQQVLEFKSRTFLSSILIAINLSDLVILPGWKVSQYSAGFRDWPGR